MATASSVAFAMIVSRSRQCLGCLHSILDSNTLQLAYKVHQADDGVW